MEGSGAGALPSGSGVVGIGGRRLPGFEGGSGPGLGRLEGAGGRVMGEGMERRRRRRRSSGRLGGRHPKGGSTVPAHPAG